MLVGITLVIVYVVWGSTYLAIRIMVEQMPPLVSTGIRFLAAGILGGGPSTWRTRGVLRRTASFVREWLA
jgi:drug/metabolite transporter (DMT)-like permease